MRLTPARRRVLELLLRGHKAQGAYDLLPLLASEGFGAQPPVVYRALSFLCKHGFAHRIEKLNAYVACVRPGRDHHPAFLICRVCDRVEETEPAAAMSNLGFAARDAGFVIEGTVLEATGLCPGCAGAA